MKFPLAFYPSEKVFCSAIAFYYPGTATTRRGTRRTSDAHRNVNDFCAVVDRVRAAFSSAPPRLVDPVFPLPISVSGGYFPHKSQPVAVIVDAKINVGVRWNPGHLSIQLTNNCLTFTDFSYIFVVHHSSFPTCSPPALLQLQGRGNSFG